ncbi:MAG TPA: IS66 family transposase [Thermomicrobiales bacterium]|nr:IS66 family transposase [Thermomicrobiales bacterium]
MSMTRPESAALYASGPDAVCAAFQQQAAQLAALTARVQELEARLGGHSQNSHRPPSSDGPGAPPRGQRARSGKRPGGQPGHPGQTLALTATPDAIIAHHPCQCAHCGAALVGVPAATVARRQVVDLPPLALAVTEHRAATVRCPRCQRPTTAPFPAQVAQPVQYGPRLLGLGVYLRHDQLLPSQRSGELLADLFGAQPSVGTRHTASLACATAPAPVEAAIAAALAAAPLLHGDEPGSKVAGARQWVHVASSATLTHDARHPQRGHAATDAIGILPRFAGRLIHDGWAPSWPYRCQHGRCNAHHLRELAAVAERAGQEWAATLHALLVAMKRHLDRGHIAGQTSSPPATREACIGRYRALLADGYAANPPPERTADGPRRGRLKQSKARNLLDRLATHEAEVLAFLHDGAVPFDNNQAERDLRMLEVQQKISGTFRDAAGADAFCRIRGYISSLRQQARHVLTARELTFAGQPPLPALQAE